MDDSYNGVELTIHGIVQGVGFRPFVHRTASQFNITGTVTNSGTGVIVRTLCRQDQLDDLLEVLQNNSPPLARITAIEQRVISVDKPWEDFTIETSVSGPVAGAMIPPDIALCDDCLHELTDPNDRRFGYPFINCTNCGPRFSIVRTIPYDRPKTSMRDFTMCPDCDGEYHDPIDRRFHAQPNACYDCGPSLSFYGENSMEENSDPIDSAVRSLCNGDVVAIRGLGGFHLAVDGTSVSAVQKLRERKRRPDKPLAIMVADLTRLKEIAVVSDIETTLLSGPQHPIVLLKKNKSDLVAANLAPGIGEIGIMLPYTPFHHLLFQHRDCPKVLVMTSGNISGEPICTSNECAFDKLDRIADTFLLHNRDIITRVDDSVARVMGKGAMMFRRARGYVPYPILLDFELPPVLGCGGGLKSTFCLARGKTAFMSQHIGDLFNLESLEFYQESVDHLQSVLEIEPEIVVCDLHPDYLSTHYGRDLGLPFYQAQHHHAHAVSVMAENGLNEKVLAVILDGTGLGPDGTVWGGEFLLCDLTSYERVGHLQQIDLPGGDSAALEPYRMALSTLHAVYGEDGITPNRLPPTLAAVEKDRIRVVGEMISNNINCPKTSSCGRLFDAVASLLGIRHVITFEGQAAMELESLAAKELFLSSKTLETLLASGDNQVTLSETDGIIHLSIEPFINSIMNGLRDDVPAERAALDFHIQLIRAIGYTLEQLRQNTGLNNVVLSGGCLQNRLLLDGLHHILEQNRFRVYTGSEIPVNDGGISLGQAIIGGLLHVSSDSYASN